MKLSMKSNYNHNFMRQCDTLKQLLKIVRKYNDLFGHLNLGFMLLGRCSLPSPLF